MPLMADRSPPATTVTTCSPAVPRRRAMKVNTDQAAGLEGALWPTAARELPVSSGNSLTLFRHWAIRVSDTPHCCRPAATSKYRHTTLKGHTRTRSRRPEAASRVLADAPEEEAQRWWWLTAGRHSEGFRHGALLKTSRAHHSGSPPILSGQGQRPYRGGVCCGDPSWTVTFHRILRPRAHT